MMEWPPKRHTAILLCSKGLEEAIKGHSVLHTRGSKRQKYKRNINGNSNNNNNNNKTNKTYILCEGMVITNSIQSIYRYFLVITSILRNFTKRQHFTI